MSFCFAFGVPVSFPVSETLLCYFVTSLARDGVAPATIRTYLAAVRHAQIIRGCPEPRVLVSPAAAPGAEPDTQGAGRPGHHPSATPTDNTASSPPTSSPPPPRVSRQPTISTYCGPRRRSVFSAYLGLERLPYRPRSPTSRSSTCRGATKRG